MARFAISREVRLERHRLVQRRRRQAVRQQRLETPSPMTYRHGRASHDELESNRLAQQQRRQAIPQRRTQTRAPLAGHFSPSPNWWNRLASKQPTTLSLLWPVDRRCRKCGTRLLNTENNDSGWCCFKGKFPSRKLPDYPPSMETVLANGRSSTISRKLNNLFCFTAIGVQGQFLNLPAPSNVTLCGRTYHRILDITRGQHSMRWFLYAPEDRIQTATGFQLEHSIVNAIEQVMLQFNPYIPKFKLLRDQPAGAPYALELKDQPAASNEIAAILHTSTITNPSPRSVIVWRNNPANNAGEFIDILSSHYEPLQYPVLFPHGTPGWSPNLHHGLTQMKYYRMLLLQNDDRFRSLGRLSNEYMVDMFSRMEDERLGYRRQGLIQRADGETNIDYRLASNWIGSRAWASEQVADSLALCREYGKPSLFITVTTNPNWHEITERLYPGQTASDQPTVVCRAFKARLSLMMQAISENMGKIIYYTKVIEFQKRGLPHAHIVLKVHPELPVEMIDSIVKAELPDATENPSLRQKVMRYNMHRVDHLSSSNNRCYKDGKCVFGYPKPLQQSTTLDASGRVVYKRQKEEDRMVVSYMPFLTELMDCHVNVDVVFTTAIFMYLYKYLFKGPDRAMYTITDPNSQHIDELKDFLNARYVSASEATWRIFSFHITQHNPAVICLPVHLPGQNFHQMQRRNANSSTASKLLRYFARPIEPQFRTLKYTDFYSRYTYRKPFCINTRADFYIRYIHKPFRTNVPLQQHQWMEQTSAAINVPQIISARVNNNITTRVVFITPRKGELFYLRALLLHNAAYSYEELRTVRGVTYETFQEAATKLGLFSDIAEVEICLLEAISSLYAPYNLRFLYAQLIVDIPSPALNIWNKYKDKLSADYAQQFPCEDAYLEALRDIQKLLTPRGAQLSDFGLPVPDDRVDEVGIEMDAFESRRHELSNAAENMITQMNEEQELAFHTIYAAATAEQPNLSVFYLNGEAGRGKTFVASALCAKLRSQRYLPVITGSTALSVTLYERGRTAHSAFGIPVSETNTDLHSNIRIDSQRALYLDSADLIIWEEMPMAHRAAIECVDELLRAITGKDSPFGGNVFLGIGDFQQVAPVVRSAGKTETVSASIISSPLWSSFTTLRLCSPIRNASDPDYACWVDAIGKGVPGIDESTVLLDLISNVKDIDDAIDFLYPPETLMQPDQCIRNSFLSPLNVFVDTFNDTMLQRLPGDEVTYFSFDAVKEDDTQPSDHPAATMDYLSLQKENGIPPHELTLKPGCICSIMRNLDINEGLVKNRRVIVEQLHERFVTVRLIATATSSTSSRQTFCIPRITFEFQPIHCPWTVQRRQIPLRLAYAATFNSCQGLTLDKVVLDLRTPVFSHGQLYCSVSRVRHRDACRKLLAEDNESGKTRNVVYQELLSPV